MPSRREVYAMEFKPTSGPARLDESRFPKFRDGDVKIIITGARQYQLHKSILTNISPLLRELLSDQYTATLSKKSKKRGAVVTNILRGSMSEGFDGKPIILLKPVKLDDGGRPISGFQVGLDLENGKPMPPVYTAWEKVLGAFYHQPINLGDFGESSLGDILPSAVEVLRAAEYLRCVPVITQHFEATLLAMGQTLFRTIAREPEQWLRLSIRMQSKPLYRESMVHAAGQYKTAEMQNALTSFPPETQQLLWSLCSGITAQVKDLTSRMLSYYPLELQRFKSKGLVDKDENSRNSYSNDILHWMALTIFRQWLGHQISEDRTHNAGDLGYDFVKLLGSGTYFKPGSAYLTEDDVNQWHEYFPMTARGRHVVETKLYEIKRQFWRAPGNLLLLNQSKLEVDKYGADYFTCAFFYTEHYPWEPKIKQEETGDDDTENDADDEGGSDEESRMDLEGAEEEWEGETGSVAPDKTVKSTKAAKSINSDYEDETEPDYGEEEFEDELAQMDPWFQKSKEDAGL